MLPRFEAASNEFFFLWLAIAAVHRKAAARSPPQPSTRLHPSPFPPISFSPFSVPSTVVMQRQCRIS